MEITAWPLVAGVIVEQWALRSVQLDLSRLLHGADDDPNEQVEDQDDASTTYETKNSTV